MLVPFHDTLDEFDNSVSEIVHLSKVPRMVGKNLSEYLVIDGSL